MYCTPTLALSLGPASEMAAKSRRFTCLGRQLGTTSSSAGKIVSGCAAASQFFHLSSVFCWSAHSRHSKKSAQPGWSTWSERLFFFFLSFFFLPRKQSRHPSLPSGALAGTQLGHPQLRYHHCGMPSFWLHVTPWIAPLSVRTACTNFTCRVGSRTKWQDAKKKQRRKKKKSMGHLT